MLVDETNATKVTWGYSLNEPRESRIEEQEESSGNDRMTLAKIRTIVGRIAAAR